MICTFVPLNCSVFLYQIIQSWNPEHLYSESVDAWIWNLGFQRITSIPENIISKQKNMKDDMSDDVHLIWTNGRRTPYHVSISFLDVWQHFTVMTSCSNSEGWLFTTTTTQIWAASLLFGIPAPRFDLVLQVKLTWCSCNLPTGQYYFSFTSKCSCSYI